MERRGELVKRLERSLYLSQASQMTRSILLIGFFLLGCIHLGAEEKDPELFTNVYVVPPTFLESKKIERRESALEKLTEAGISFTEGTSAIYNPATSQLIVRNTQDQMELVEAYIETIRTRVQTQVFITIREIEFDKKPDFPSDWFDASNITRHNERPKSSPLNSRDDLVEALRRPPHSDSSEAFIAESGVVGVFTEPQFQAIFRNLANKLNGSKIVSAPSVMTRSEKPALIEVGERRWGVVPEIHYGNEIIGLEFFFPPHGEALSHDSPSLAITQWDGQTIAWAEEMRDGRYRVVFVTSRIMDPAGMPVNPDVETLPERAAKEQAKSNLSLTTEQHDQVKEADEAALRGSQLMAGGDFRGAVYKYRLALEWLPEHEMTDPRRTAYEKQMNRAMRLSKPQESDLHAVEKGETIFGIASRYGISVFELKELNNLDNDILKVGQLLVIPEASKEDNSKVGPEAPNADPRLESALKDAIISSFEVREIPLTKAVELIRIALLSNLDSGVFPEVAPRFVFQDNDKATETRITVRLSNVTVSEALRYVCQLANCRCEVEDDRVVISRL